MARIMSYSNIIELSSDSEDDHNDNESKSTYHEMLVGNHEVFFKQYQSALSSQPKHAPQNLEQTAPGLKTVGEKASTTVNHQRPNLPQPRDPPSRLRLSSPLAEGGQSSVRSLPPSRPPRRANNVASTPLSPIAGTAISREISRKRNAEEAFKADANHVLSPHRPAPGFSLLPFSTRTSKLARPKEVKGRSDFSVLIARAEAEVVDVNEDDGNGSGRSKATPNKQRDTSSNSVKKIQPTSPFPTFAPPSVLSPSLGSSMRIVPIDQATARTVRSAVIQTAAMQTYPPRHDTSMSQRPPSPARIYPPDSRPSHIETLNHGEHRTHRLHGPLPVELLTHHSQEPSAMNRPARGVVNHSPFDDSSILIRRGGHPFTEAEQIMLIYLKEELSVSWTDMDRKMGRTTNCCATKYLRKVIGVKYQKEKLKYWERAAFIRAIFGSYNTVTMEQLFRSLTEFIRSGAIPSECAALFETFSKATPPSTDQPLPVKNMSTKEPLQPPHEFRFDNTSLRELRPSARTAVGEMDLKAMTRRFRERDSLESSSDATSFCSEIEYSSNSDMEHTTALEHKEYPEDAFVQRKRPYLSYQERRILTSGLGSVDWSAEGDWTGISLHLDPNEHELEALELCTHAVLGKDTRYSLGSLLKNASDSKLAEIACCATRLPDLQYRTQKSVLSMLTDAASQTVNRAPTRLRVAPPQIPASEQQITTRLLKRELGGASPSRGIRQLAYDSLAPSRSWTGTSGDVGAVAWSPNGIHFAAGSICLMDSTSMQYNRPNNLLLGNTLRHTLHELPHHAKLRKRPDEGVNSTHSMHVSQDPRLFYTVSMVDFSRDSSYMFSAGYDNYVRAYEVRDGRSDLTWAADLGVEVDLLTTSRHHDLLATGCRDIESSIRVYNADGSLSSSYNSSKAKLFFDRKIFPSSLRWGTHNLVKDYLLGGFSPTNTEEGQLTHHGETCLWDVTSQIPISINPAAGNIFDCAWSPLSCVFASACTAYGQSVNRGTHSLIRICSPVDVNRWDNRRLELECPARDINDVVFCPYDQNYIAAGATDGEVYIWDIRRPDSLLQQLGHGRPLAELRPDVARESADVGVRFCGWGDNRSRLYTGSSDGVLKVWDIFRAPEDVHIRDAAAFNSGIMSGAFNHDFTNLLIGEDNGTINHLEVGGDSSANLKDLDSFQFQSASTLISVSDPDAQSQPADKDSGVWSGRRLRKSRQIKMRPMGGFPVRQATQGKNYEGPYDNAPDAEQLREEAAQFQTRLRVQNPNEQCPIPLCRESVKVTSEEAGDSGRAVDRIPQALRTTGGNTRKMVPGMLRCLRCDGLARPRVGDAEQEEFPHCERCGFSCFRCGERVRMGMACEKVVCRSCDLEWDAGALGYKIIRAGGKEAKMDVDWAKKIETKAGGLDNMEDLLSLVEDYHHGLWQDRPSSPL